MLRALDLEAGQQETSPSIKRNREIITIRRENRTKLFTEYRKMQQGGEEVKGGNEDKEGTEKVVEDEYREMIEEFEKIEVRCDEFDKYERLTQSEEVADQLQGLICMHKLINLSDFDVDKYLKNCTIDRLLFLLEQSSSLQVKLSSLIILACVAACQTPLCTYITSRNCARLFLQVLPLGNLFIEQSMWFVANMACGSTIFRNKYLNEGGGRELIELMDKIKGDKTEKYIAWALSNLCRGNPLPQYDQVKDIVVCLCTTLAQGRIEEPQTFSDCLWAISHHVLTDKKEISQVIASNISIKCIDILNTEKFHPDEDLVLPSLRIICRILEGSAEHVQYLLDNYVIDALQKMLYHERTIMRRQASFGLSNIAAGTLNHIELLIDNDCLINRLREMIERDSIPIRFEIAILFCNLCTHRELDLDVFIIGLEIVEHFQDLLNSQDEEKVLTLLDRLDLPLRLSQQRVKDGFKYSSLSLQMQQKNILAILQSLQYHQNDFIYERASYLISQYFDLFLEDPLTRLPIDQPQVKCL